MIVLGLNGKLDGHDPAAVLAVDNKVIAAVEEERISTVRHHPGGLPRQAAAWALRHAGLSVADLDLVALGWDPRRQADAPEPDSDTELLDLLLPRGMFPTPTRPQLVRVTHHLAHATGAWATSGYRDCAVLVVDGSGERESTSIWHGHGGNRLDELVSLPFANSLGFFYQALTQHVGMRMFDEGKTMGLAAWGDTRWALPSVIEAPPVAAVAKPDTAHYQAIVRGWQRVFERVTGLGPARRGMRSDPTTCRTERTAPPLGSDYRDLAASGQARLVADLRQLAADALRRTGEPLLALSGGVALNCAMNGVLEAAISPVDLHVQPACNDTGVALGAACWAALTHGSRVEVPAGHVYGGPAFTAGFVADALREWNVAVRDVDDPYRAAGALLAEGKVVALFEGGAEFGPRALGGRSILADASRPELLERVNTIKKREHWRPLGPALHSAEAEKVFGRAVNGDYMLVARPVADGQRDALPAAVHVDGTARAQVVRHDLAPGLSRLVSEVQARTGTPALINTSFNVRGPIVLTPQHAMATFATSGLDALLIEGHLIQK